MEEAGIQPEDIDYVNAHGTSTPANDTTETKVLKKALGEHAYKVHISSTKSMTGHLLGGAGAIEAIATILAINEDMVPPTINFEEPDPECDLNYTPNEAVKKDIRYALKESFGFGGHNSAVIFKRWEE
jgi:3-oxoacyl-[acyl-carrier-protein] synthase II